MSADPGDLANLADLVLPATISFLPPAAGLWILGGAAGAGLVVAAWRALARYRADAYLRRAAAELDAAAREEEGAVAVSAVLKRAAMVAYGRERVASLSGAGWASFIRETAPAGEPRDRLAARFGGLFSGAKAPLDPAVLAADAKSWLRSQRGRVSQGR